jgi:hypothetical protein
MLLLLMLFILNESYSIENNSKEWIKYKNKYSKNIT